MLQLCLSVQATRAANITTASPRGLNDIYKQAGHLFQPSHGLFGLHFLSSHARWSEINAHFYQLTDIQLSICIRQAPAWTYEYIITCS